MRNGDAEAIMDVRAENARLRESNNAQMVLRMSENNDLLRDAVRRLAELAERREHYKSCGPPHGCLCGIDAHNAEVAAILEEVGLS